MVKSFLGIVISAIFFLTSCKQGKDELENLNGDEMIHLDAEDLAEAGIKEIYEKRVVPYLRQYVTNPTTIEDILNHDNSEYRVKSNNKIYLIYNDKIPEYVSWGNATYVLFDIVNQQLVDSNYKFYAFYNGNDLNGMFLSEAEYQHYLTVIDLSKYRLTDLPYIPTSEPEWFGQHHD